MSRHRFVARLLAGAVLSLGMSFGCSCSMPDADGPNGSHGSAQLYQLEDIAEMVPTVSGGSRPIKVVCTTGMVADIIRNVGGRHVEVTQLMGEHIDPHIYKTTPGDTSHLKRADVIFYSGLHLEGNLASIFSRISEQKPTIPLAQFIDGKQLLTVEDGLYDPHVWFDVKLWSTGVPVAAEVLATYDPSNASEYRENAKTYVEMMDTLDEYCRSQIASIPKQQRVLVTAHDAFHYMEQAYGLEVKSVQGVSTAAEAGVKDINDLIEVIINRNIKVVFHESSVPSASVQALIEGCAARNYMVREGGELFSDAMGKLGTPKGTYEGMIRHNIDAITNALK